MFKVFILAEEVYFDVRGQKSLGEKVAHSIKEAETINSVTVLEL